MPASPECPVCSGRGGSSLAPYNGYAMRQCDSCRFIFTLARSFPATIYEELYAHDESYLHWLHVVDDLASGKGRRREIGWFRRLALRWLRTLPVRKCLLDVGCGAGVFLVLAQRDGWDTHGIEPTAAAAAKARSLGLDVHCGYVEDYPKEPPGRFGVVVCFEVLEHVPDPLAVLREIHALLAPGGYLIASVPNAGDPYCLKQMWKSTMPPVHINFFDRRSLPAAMRGAGFHVRRIRSPLIPTTSVKNLFGRTGFILRAPYLLGLRLVGRSDGSGLLVLAERA